MELKNTVDLMNSADYKERFQAEYLQAKIRYDKLHEMIVKYEAKTLDFRPSCSIELLKEQKKHMGNYLYCLQIRAEIEGISLKSLDEAIAYKEYVKASSYETSGTLSGTITCTNAPNASL